MLRFGSDGLRTLAEFVHRNGSEDMLYVGSDRLRTPAEVALHDCAAVVWSSGVVRDCVHPGSPSSRISLDAIVESHHYLS